MNIRADAKRIVQLLLDYAIEGDGLNELLALSYGFLTKELKLPSENYCRICCQYLAGMGYIREVREDNGMPVVKLHAQAIDFLETT